MAKKATLTVWFADDTAPDELEDLTTAAVETVSRFRRVDAVTSDYGCAAER